jgi:hypothetical protein
MVRGKITEYYANRIEFLYKPEAKSIVNEPNMISIAEVLG